MGVDEGRERNKDFTCGIEEKGQRAKNFGKVKVDVLRSYQGPAVELKKKKACTSEIRIGILDKDRLQFSSADRIIERMYCLCAVTSVTRHAGGTLVLAPAIGTLLNRRAVT